MVILKKSAKMMRKALSILLAVALLMSVCTVMLSTFASAYTTYTPKVTELTFDNGKGAACFRNATVTYKGYVDDPDPDYAGDKAVYMETPNSNSPMLVLGSSSETDTVESGTQNIDSYKFETDRTYTVSFKYKLAAGYTGDSARLDALGFYSVNSATNTAGKQYNSSSIISQIVVNRDEINETDWTPVADKDGVYTLNADSAWKEVTITFKRPSDYADSFGIILLGYQGGARKIYFDDIVITDANAATPKTVETTNTYVYNFIDDETGAPVYNAVGKTIDYTSDKTLTTDDRGLIVSTSSAIGNGGGNLTGEKLGILLKDPDVNLGDANGYLKLEANTDYGIVFKYKVLNKQDIIDNNPSYAENESFRFHLTCTKTATPSLSGNSTGTSLAGGLGSSDLFRTTNDRTNLVTVSDDGWRYFHFEFSGSDFFTRGSSYVSEGMYICFNVGAGAAYDRPVEFLIESATVTATKCETKHTYNTAEYSRISFKENHSNDIYGVQYLTPGDKLVAPKGYTYFNVTNGAKITTVPTSDATVVLRPDAGKYVYDFTDAQAVTTYSSMTHNNFSNKLGTDQGTNVANAGGKPSQVVAGEGMYLTSTTGNPTGTTSYGWSHKAYIADTDNPLGKNGFLAVEAGYLYYVDVEFSPVVDNYSQYAGTKYIAVALSNGTNSNGTLGETQRSVSYLAIAKDGGVQHVTASIDGDEKFTGRDDPQFGGDVTDRPIAGANITIALSANATVLITKVTVYMIDKNSDKVFLSKDNGEYELATEGVTLVTAPNSANSASIGWFDDSGVKQTTVPAGDFVSLTSKYASEVYNFDTQSGDLYLPRKAAQGNWIYEFETDATEHGDVLKLTTNQTGGTTILFAVPSASGLGNTSPYRMTQGVKHRVTFDVKRVAANIPEGKDDAIQIYRASEAGVGAGGNKTRVKTLNYTTKDLDVWQTISFEFTPTDLSNGQNILLIGFGTGSKADENLDYNAQVCFDNVKIELVDYEIYSKPAAGVKSSIRKVSGTGEAYVSAGVRFRATLDSTTINDASEIGFVVIPETYAQSDPDWYLMKSNGSLTNTNAKRAFVKNIDTGTEVVYNTNPDGSKDYQLILTGLTQEGAPGNLCGTKFVAVLFIKTGDTYSYQFVRSVSYNEVKQMYTDAGLSTEGY